MSRLRVLHAITMLELGGAQRNTLDTVAALDRRADSVASRSSEVVRKCPSISAFNSTCEASALA